MVMHHKLVNRIRQRNKFSARILSVSILCIFAFGCTPDTSDPNSAIPKEDIEGSWISMCSGRLSPDGVVSSRTILLQFDALKTTQVETEFSSPSCDISTKFLTTKFRGRIILGEKTSASGSPRNLDILFDAVSITPHTQAGADEGARGTGLTYVVDQETDLSDLKRAWLDQFHVYDIYAVDGNAIRFGQLTPNFDKSAVEKRPVTLDGQPIYTRVDAQS